MMLPHPIIVHPFVLNLGPLQFTGFGLAILMCFVIGQTVAQSELSRRGLDPEPISDMIFAAVIGSLLGAKLYYVVVLQNWDAMFDRGGFVYWGGLIGGSIAVLAVTARKRFGFRRIFEVGSLGVAGAYSVGRTGCWAVGDDYGKPWNGFLAVAFPQGAPPSTAGVMLREFGIPMPPGAGPTTLLSVHPTQLYEVALGLVMFAILWRIRDHKHAEGWLFGPFAVLSGLERFFIEFYRAKDDRLLAGLTYAQVISIAFVVIGVIWMFAFRRVREGWPGIYPPSAAPVIADSGAAASA
jgi:phosphatidylglycerol:prolipoprotein diacylglycerol transferase